MYPQARRDALSWSQRDRELVSMRIASYNVQNLFERAVALSAEANDAGDEALVKQGEINVLLRKAVYSDDDRARILELLTELGLRDGGNFRKGVFSASDRWPVFDTIESKADQASDHAAVWADLDLR